MNQQTIERDFEEHVDLDERVDVYEEDYAQELLDDDALELAEVAFLKGYMDMA